MAPLLLIILLCIALAGTVRGMMYRDRYYQFPTLFCATWLLYLGPQAIGAVLNKHKYPESLRADYGLELALFFCILCTIAGLAGYACGGRTKRKLFQYRNYSYDRLFLGGIVLYAVGLWGAYELAQLSGGFIAQFTGGGFYSMEWRGAAVKYSFFSRLVYPGFLLIFLSTLYRPSRYRWIIVCLCVVYPLALTVFAGRRSMTATLAVTILLSLFFAKHWAPSRLIFTTLLVLATAGVILGPAYRSRSQYGLNMQELSQIDARGIISDTFSGERYAEFDMIVYGCAAANRSLAFECGLGFYNATIGALVPRQLVGEEFKSSLFLISKEDVGQLMVRYYNWPIPYGTNPTGPFDAFKQFWFFGCLLYFVLGYVYRHLWAAAYQKANLGAQLWYVYTVLYIPSSIVGSWCGFAPTLLVALVFFGTILYLAHSPYDSSQTWAQNLGESTTSDEYCSYNTGHITYLPTVGYPTISSNRRNG